MRQPAVDHAFIELTATGDAQPLVIERLRSRHRLQPSPGPVDARTVHALLRYDGDRNFSKENVYDAKAIELKARETLVVVGEVFKLGNK